MLCAGLSAWRGGGVRSTWGGDGANDSCCVQV